MVSRSIFRWIIAGVLSCLLVLKTATNSLAQLSPFAPPSTNSQQVLGWNPNRAYACGRLLCSDVFLPGTIGRSFTLAQNIAPGDPKEELEVAIADRANLVENIVASIQRTILNRKGNAWLNEPNNTSLVQRDRRWYRDRLFRQIDNPVQQLFHVFNHANVAVPIDVDLHPDTPEIGVGPENNQIVVFIPPQPEQGLAQQTIVTVTDLDLINAGIPPALSESRRQTTAQTTHATSAAPSTHPDVSNPHTLNQNGLERNDDSRSINPDVEALARVWRNQIRNRLSNGLWGKDYDSQYPFDRLSVVAGLVGMTIGLIWLLGHCQQLFRRWRRRLRKRNQTIQQVLMQNRELATTEGPLERDDDGDTEDSVLEASLASSVTAHSGPEHSETAKPSAPLNETSPSPLSAKPPKVTSIAIEELKQNPLSIFNFDRMVIDPFQNLVQKVSLDEQSRNRQLHNLLQLLKPLRLSSRCPSRWVGNRHGAIAC